MLFRSWIAIATVAVGGLITLLGGFKSEAEKVAEANAEVTKTFVEQKDRINALKDSLRSAEDAYTTLAESGMDAVQILSSGNQELIDTYLKYAEAVADINPAMVKGYDAQGRAIVDLTDGVCTATA